MTERRFDVWSGRTETKVNKQAFRRFSSAVALATTALGVGIVDAKVFYDWPIGLEREVDEGFYMKVVAVENGWRIWRIETKSEVECRAIKSVRGQPHPIPVGVGGAFFRGTPNLMIYKGSRSNLTYAWSGEHLNERTIQIRRPGDKFWKQIKNYDSQELYRDGALLEVNVQSWEYPEIYVGLSDEKGIIDLTGLAAAQERVRTCK